jgi:2-acylglycerol O-acyltransferase 2
MAAPAAAPLNAEPAQSEERKKQHLPPKSYADAVEETPPSEGSNGSKDANGSNGTSKINGANGVGDDGAKQTGHKASVLGIVDTGAPETKEKQAERPELERQESKHEYSATVCPPSILAHLTPTYYHKRASTIPRELLHDTNIEKLDPKVTLDHRIS